MQITNSPLKWTIPFANGDSGRVEVPATTADPTKASLTLGFPPLTREPPDAGGVPPHGEDFNGAMNQVARIAWWQMGGGRFSYDATFATDTNINGYPQGGVLASSDQSGAWVSLTDNNAANPDTVGTGWAPLSTYGVTVLTGQTGGTATLTPVQAMKRTITIAGTLTSNLTVVVPAWTYNWQVSNLTTGAFTVTVKTAAGSGALIPQTGTPTPVTGDGTNVASADYLRNDLASTAAGKGAALIGLQGGGTVQDLATNASGKGAALVPFNDSLATAYLKTTSDILNGEEVSFFRFLPPSQYAAIRAGTSSYDILADFNTANAAFAVKGYGSLLIPYGLYNLSSNGVIQFNGHIRGEGAGATVIQSTSATADHFSLNYAGQFTFSGLSLTTSVTKTAGAGISVNGTGGGASVKTHIHNIETAGLFYGINMANASYWTIRDGFIGESVKAGIRVDNTQNFDAGDNLIAGVVIQRTGVTAGTAGILHVASGGTKVIGNKILGHDRGYSLIPRVGATSVIDTVLTGNSIENCNNGIYVDTPNASTSVGQMVLNSNQISAISAGINLNGTLNGATVNANQIAVNSASGIGIYTGPTTGSPAQVIVACNQITGNSSASSQGIYGYGLTGIEYDNNNISGVVTPYANIAGLIRGATFTFATLPAAANGSIVYCSDGTAANPVASGGTGCIAKRLNGVWVGN